MANIKSAIKRAKQAEVKRQINLARKTAIKTAIKKVMTALERGENAVELLKDAEAKLARSKSKGTLHANTASRKISRLAKRVAAAARA